MLNKTHFTSFIFSKRIMEDCIVSWEQGIIPSIEQLKYDYEILDLDGRCIDPVSYYRFWSAIDRLSVYGFIAIEQDPYMIKRISKGPRTIPEKLSYEQLWSVKD